MIMVTKEHTTTRLLADLMWGLLDVCDKNGKLALVEGVAYGPGVNADGPGVSANGPGVYVNIKIATLFGLVLEIKTSPSR